MKNTSANMQVMGIHNTHITTTYCVRHTNDNEMSNHSAKRAESHKKKEKNQQLGATDKTKHEKKKRKKC